MTEESLSNSHLSVAMATTKCMAQITGETTMTSSLSLGSEFYFHCVLLVVGVVGTATNGLILYALVVSKQHKKQVLIVHQNVLDLFTSVAMIVTYTVKLCNIYLTGSVGYWLCMLLLGESFVWCGTFGSVINLACITIERYLKVVHSVWSNGKLRNWMIYLAMAFTWIVSFTVNGVVVFPSTAVVNGVCYAYAIWENDTARIVNFFMTFVLFYVIIILIFIFCYWRILVVIRRQARVMASHAETGANTANAQTLHQLQSSVINTMIYVGAFYAISWLPIYVYVLYMNMNPNINLADGGYYASATIAFLYMCTNPFVYATKFDPVREVLLRLFRCKKTSG